MNGRELFVPKNFLEHCLGLQELIADAAPDEKRSVGNDVRQMVLNSEVSYYGATKLEIHTLGAFALPDGLTLESEIWPIIHYPAMRLSGTLGNIAFMSVHRLNSLAWMLIDPLVRTSTANSADLPPELDSSPDSETANTIPVLVDQKLRRPLYIPVGMIESVLAAA